MNIVANQVILNICDCDPRLLMERNTLKDLLCRTVLKTKCTIDDYVCKSLSRSFVLSIVLQEGGHVRLVTHPDKNFFILDACVFNEKINMLAFVDTFVDYFDSHHYTTRFIDHVMIPSESTLPSSSSEVCSKVKQG